MSAEPIAVVVVNWNRRDDVLRCLASLAASRGARADVIVVDNASTDGSADALEAAFPDARVIRNQRNDGFAEGNNIALRVVLERDYRYVMLLNNDTVVAPDALSRLRDALENNAALGAVSPAMCYLSAPDTVWSAGGQINWRTGAVTSAWQDVPRATLPAHPYLVDHVSGCCMLLRAEVIARAGLLDPRFFMYFEETEWCARIARCGYGIAVEPRAFIWHAIEPQRQAGSPAIAYYMTRNHLLFLRATRAPLSAWAVTLFRQARTVVSLFIRPHTAERARGRMPMLRGMRDCALGRFGPVTGG
jgi:GT2 family glycosyltransferase